MFGHDLRVSLDTNNCLVVRYLRTLVRPSGGPHVTVVAHRNAKRHLRTFGGSGSRARWSMSATSSRSVRKSVLASHPSDPPFPLGKKPRRSAVIVLASVALVSLSFSWLAGAASGSQPLSAYESSEAIPPAQSPAVYVVRSGDTLWSIARRLRPTDDIRATVDRLAAVNGGPALTPGQRLKLE